MRQGSLPTFQGSIAARQIGSLNKASVGELLIFAVIFGLAIVTRLYQIGAESVWLDEQFSIRDAEQLRLGTRPLYYLLLHGWMWMGSSDAWLRLFSTIFSVASVFLIYALARRLTTPATALIAAFMAAISPVFVGYGQEIRMYALSTFLTLAGTLALVRMINRPEKFIFATWLGLRLLAILTTPLNVLILGADVLIFAWNARHKPRRLAIFAGSVLGMAVLLAPAAYMLRHKFINFFDGWIASRSKPGMLDVSSILAEFTIFWPMTELPEKSRLQLSPAAFGIPEAIWIFYAIATLCVLGLFAISLGLMVRQIRSRDEQSTLLWLTLWALVPMASILAISYLFATVWFARYLLFAAPYALILIAAGFSFLWQRFRLPAIMVAIIYVAAAGGGLWYYYAADYHDDWKGINELIVTHEQPGDVVALFPLHWEPQHSLPRYYTGEAPVVLWPDYQRVDEDEIPRLVSGMLDSMPDDAERYWVVVYYHNWLFHPTLRAEIDRRYKVLIAEEFPNAFNDAPRVYLLEPRTEPLLEKP